MGASSENFQRRLIQVCSEESPCHLNHAMKCDGRKENKSEVCLETSEFKVKTSRARGAVHGRKADVPFCGLDVWRLVGNRLELDRQVG